MTRRESIGRAALPVVAYAVTLKYELQYLDTVITTKVIRFYPNIRSVVAIPCPVVGLPLSSVSLIRLRRQSQEIGIAIAGVTTNIVAIVVVTAWVVMVVVGVIADDETMRPQSPMSAIWPIFIGDLLDRTTLLVSSVHKSHVLDLTRYEGVCVTLKENDLATGGRVFPSLYLIHSNRLERPGPAAA